MSDRIHISGYCNPSNPPDSHARCVGSYDRGPAFGPVPCECSCHKDGALVPEPGTTGGPTSYLVTSAEPETPEWFAARRAGITGTDLPKILGLTKYGNALSVWLDKRDELDDDAAGEAARWGHILEDPVAQEWAAINGTQVDRIGVLAHVDAPWMRVSLDRVVVDCPEDEATHRMCGLEIKTRSAFLASEWRDGMPDSVLAQVAWGRLVSGFDHMHVAALIGGQRLVTFRYDRDEVLEGYLVDHARPVWEGVELGLRPEVDPDGDGVLLGLLDKLYASHEGDREVPAGEAAKWLGMYDDGHDLEKRGAQMKTAAKTGLVQLLGDGATGLIDGDPVFTYTAHPAKDTVTAEALRAFKATEPEQYAAFVRAGLITTTNPRPTFRVKKRGITA